MKRVHSPKPRGRENTGPFERRRAECRMVMGKVQQLEQPGAPVRLSIPFDLLAYGFAADPLVLSHGAQGQDCVNGLSFDADARLRLVVERAIQAADIELDAHGGSIGGRSASENESGRRFGRPRRRSSQSRPRTRVRGSDFRRAVLVVFRGQRGACLELNWPARVCRAGRLVRACLCRRTAITSSEL